MSTKKLDFTEKLKRIEATLDAMENNQIPLEKLIEQHKNTALLIEECQQELEKLSVHLVEHSNQDTEKKSQK